MAQSQASASRIWSLEFGPWIFGTTELDLHRDLGVSSCDKTHTFLTRYIRFPVNADSGRHGDFAVGMMNELPLVDTSDKGQRSTTHRKYEPEDRCGIPHCAEP